MPYRVRLNKIKGKDDAKKEIDIVFPVKGAGIAKIFPAQRGFSSTELIKAFLEALKVSIEELLVAYGYDEARIKYAGVHLVEILHNELVYLHDIKNYESRWQVEWSTEQY